MQPTNEQLAWAAGFFDGEGCIILRKAGLNKYAVRITVSQVNPAPIPLFKEWFGGHVSYQTPKNQKWKAQWKWEQDCKSAVETLKLLLPYLIVKKDVALLAIDFQKTKRYGKLTPEKLSVELEFKSKITALNHKD